MSVREPKSNSRLRSGKNARHPGTRNNMKAAAAFTGWEMRYSFIPDRFLDYHGDPKLIARNYARSLQSAMEQAFPGAKIKVAWEPATTQNVEPEISARHNDRCLSAVLSRNIIDQIGFIADKVYFEGHFFLDHCAGP